MKRILSFIMAAVTAVTFLSFSMSASALDMTTITADVLQNSVGISADGQWKTFAEKTAENGVFYKIVVDKKGKLNVKIQSSSALEVSLRSEDLSLDYFTVLTLNSDQERTNVRNRVIPAGTYYLYVKTNGQYKLNLTFGGNSYVNPQTLDLGTQVNGKSTQDEDSWWYKINVDKDAMFVIKALTYGDAEFDIYNDDLAEVVSDIVLVGGSNAPASERKVLSLSKGVYYVKVDSTADYMFSWEMLTKDNCEHTIVHQYIKSTYTEKGYQLHRCTVCGYSYKDNYSAKKKLSAPALYQVKKGSKKLSVHFSRSFNATGYQIQYATNSKFKGKSVKKISTKNLSKTIKKLKGKKKYYVRVRAYKKVSGKTVFSSWSETKSVITKK